MTGPRRARHCGGAGILPAVRLLALSCLILVALGGASGCSTNCQQLCTAWYDYQRDVCGAVNLDDDRVTCISDYRRSQSSTSELSACAARIPDVTALRAAGDDRCCTWTIDQCPEPGGDDDSAR
jgi:hypothetical protein